MRAVAAGPLCVVQLQARFRPRHDPKPSAVRQSNVGGEQISPAEADIGGIGVRHFHLLPHLALRRKHGEWPVFNVATQMLPLAVTARLSNRAWPVMLPTNRPPCAAWVVSFFTTPGETISNAQSRALSVSAT